MKLKAGDKAYLKSPRRGMLENEEVVILSAFKLKKRTYFDVKDTSGRIHKRFPKKNLRNKSKY